MRESGCETVRFDEWTTMNRVEERREDVAVQGALREVCWNFVKDVNTLGGCRNDFAKLILIPRTKDSYGDDSETGDPRRNGLRSVSQWPIEQDHHDLGVLVTCVIKEVVSCK